MFLPKHKRKDSQTIVGEPLVDKVSGVIYYGPYFETSTGKKFSGTTPYSDNVRELEDLPEDGILPGSDITIRNSKNAYDILRKDPEAFKLKFTAPLPSHFPVTIPAGVSFKRYFAKDIRTEKIIEISQQTFSELKNRDSKYYYPNFVTVEVVWVVEGPVEDTVSGAYIVPGIATQNKNAVQRANRTVAGLDQYLTDYTQFAR